MEVKDTEETTLIAKDAYQRIEEDPTSNRETHIQSRPVFTTPNAEDGGYQRIEDPISKGKPDMKSVTSPDAIDGYQRIEDGIEKDQASKRKTDMPGLPIFMQEERSKIQDMFDDNKLMLDKWIQRDNDFKQVQRVLVAFTMIGAAVIGIAAGVQMDPILSFVSAGLAAFAALKDPLTKLFITDNSTKKRMKYMDKCKVIKECLDGMYLSYVQANQDGKISVEELKKYQTLEHAMYAKLFDIEADLTPV